MQWFVNYRLDNSLAVSDRGLAYGDGVFETIRAFPNKLCSLSLHLDRLYRGLLRLGMPFSVQQKQTLLDFLSLTLLPSIEVESVVKIIVTRGSGGRGYFPPQECQHSILVGVLSAPDYQSQREKGVSLAVSPVPVNSNRFLAGLKHLNRLENVLAKQYLADSDFEAIMLNDHREVVECIQSNVFWFKDNVLYTPSLDRSGVQGTCRSRIIDGQNTYVVQVGRFMLEDVMTADEVFVTNSLMGVIPVTMITGVSFPIGIHTRKLQILMQTKDVHGSY